MTSTCWSPMSWTYTRGIAELAQCSRIDALLKVARHSDCSHGWDLSPNTLSPYEAPVHMPSATGPACECVGMVPPKSLTLQAGARQEVSEDALFLKWDRCGRCGHSLRCHGYLELDPKEEQARRIKVAIRMDELLEVRGALLTIRTWRNCSTFNTRTQIWLPFEGKCPLWPMCGPDRGRLLAETRRRTRKIARLVPAGQSPTQTLFKP